MKLLVNGSMKILSLCCFVIKLLYFHRSRKLGMYNKTLQFIPYNSLESELRCLKKLWWVLHGRMTGTRQGTHFVCSEPRLFVHLGDVCLKFYDGAYLQFKKIVDRQSTRHQPISYQFRVWLLGWLLKWH